MVQETIIKIILITVVFLFIIIEYVSLRRKDIGALTNTASKHTMLFILILYFISDKININRLPNTLRDTMVNISEAGTLIALLLTIYTILSIIYIKFGAK